MRAATLLEYVRQMIGLLLIMLVACGFMVWMSIKAVSAGAWWFPLPLVAGVALIGWITWWGHKQAVVCECGLFLFKKHKYCPDCGRQL